MNEVVEYIILIVVVGGIFLTLRAITKPRKRHNWYEVGSSDIANAERQKKRGK